VRTSEAGSAIVLVVPREAAGSRLDRFVAGALAGRATRSQVQRWIEGGRVTVDGIGKHAADTVREGERVVVVPELPPPTRALPEAGIGFDVMHLDDALVVVNKPPGLVVHPAKGHSGGTLVNGLLGMGLFARSASDDHDRPGIVHRLDKGTSGVMVVARSEDVREKLKVQFQAHTIDREYVALCAGKVEARTISTLHGRHPTDRMRFSSRVARGKRAVTQVRVLEELGEGSASYVACTLETGRTHQIRVHLADSGTPILGDPLYGKPPKVPAVRTVAEALGHQALHARLLGFTHPVTGARVRFEAPPPLDFLRALETLRAL
jgi:23S rRNA pseudouridine1911/1915/1917 synthase